MHGGRPIGHKRATSADDLTLIASSRSTHEVHCGPHNQSSPGSFIAQLLPPELTIFACVSDNSVPAPANNDELAIAGGVIVARPATVDVP